MDHILVAAAFVLLFVNLAMLKNVLDEIVLEGDSIVLNCTVNTTGWSFLPPSHTGHDTGDVDLYAGGDGLLPGLEGKGFGITGNRTVGVNLIITNVTSDKAGVYVCLQNKEPFNDYKLTVLENFPVCRVTPVSDDRIALCAGSKTQHGCNGPCISPQSDSVRGANNEFIGPNICNIPQDQILVSCSVTYYGNDTPVLELRNLRDNKIINTSCKTTKLDATMHYYRLTCNVTLNATMDLDGTQFIWQTNQSTQKQYNCTTEPIKIIYSIDGPSSNHKTAQLHDQLNCTANCSHPCSYKWTWSEKSGQGLLKYEECTKEVMANRTGSYRCEAMCQMGKYVCEVTVMQVEVSSYTASQQVGNQANDGSKTSVSIAATIVTLGVCWIFGIS